MSKEYTTTGNCAVHGLVAFVPFEGRNECYRCVARLEEVTKMTVVEQIVAEVGRATNKFPTWPTDPLHALAVLGEEYGELNKAILQLTYEPHKTSANEVRTEAIQTAAMALRLAMSLDRYEYRKCDQHEQG